MRFLRLTAERIGEVPHAPLGILPFRRSYTRLHLFKLPVGCKRNSTRTRMEVKTVATASVLDIAVTQRWAEDRLLGRCKAEAFDLAASTHSLR